MQLGCNVAGGTFEVKEFLKMMGQRVRIPHGALRARDFLTVDQARIIDAIPSVVIGYNGDRSRILCSHESTEDFGEVRIACGWRDIDPHSLEFMSNYFNLPEVIS